MSIVIFMAILLKVESDPFTPPWRLSVAPTSLAVKVKSPLRSLRSCWNGPSPSILWISNPYSAALATLASFKFLPYSEHNPTSGPLHLLFALPQWAHGSSLTSFRSIFKCHLLSESVKPPYHLMNDCTSPVSHMESCFFLHCITIMAHQIFHLKKQLFIYLAASGLSHGTRHLPCVTQDLLLWCTDSPGVGCRHNSSIACGILVP